MTRTAAHRRLAVLPLLAAALFGLAACNTTTTGNGSPATNDPSAGSGATTGSGGGGGGTTSLQPCDLLGADAVSANQLTKSDSGSGSGARSCAWDNTTQNNGAGYSLGIDIRDSQGIKDANQSGYTQTTDKIGSHNGVQLRSGSGNDCIVAIGVTSSSRVDVVISTSGGGACQVANLFATLVEPHLPSGNG